MGNGELIPLFTSGLVFFGYGEDDLQESVKLKEGLQGYWSETDIANFAQSYVNDGEEVTRENVVADLENTPYFTDMFDEICNLEPELQDEASANYAEELDRVADAVVAEIKSMGGKLVEEYINTKNKIEPNYEDKDKTGSPRVH